MPNAMTKVPLIVVEDWTVTPVVTRKYFNGDNILDLEDVFCQIKDVESQAHCPHGDFSISDDQYWHEYPCFSCEQSFANAFWDAAARLVDYFADFYNTDNPLMQSVWFGMFDLWQVSAGFIPHPEDMERVWNSNMAVDPWVTSMDKARDFGKHVAETIELVSNLLHGSNKRTKMTESELHHPYGDLEIQTEIMNTGPFISGLKPWQQFLFANSPGTAFTTPRLASADTPGLEHRRQIPMPLIAIIQGHTEEMRAIAEEIYARDFPDSFDEKMAEFDANVPGLFRAKHAHAYKLPVIDTQQSLPFPRMPEKQVYSYIDMTGHRLTYHLADGSPPISASFARRDPHWREKKPSLSLLDEYVAWLRGCSLYEPQSQNSENAAGDSREATPEDDLAAFDMWVVYHSDKQAEGWVNPYPNFHKSFNNWHIDDEDAKQRGARLLSSAQRF